MAASDFSVINVGGPCKITDAGTVLYSEDDVTIEPKPVFRKVGSSVDPAHDDVLVDLTYEISFTPKPVWDANYRGALLPAAFYNWTASGGRMVGSANRAVTVLGQDGEQYAFTRARCTAMPDLYLGLGSSLYGKVTYEAFLGAGKLLTDVDAFYVLSTAAEWSQTDYPSGHQEALCTGAWTGITGWSTVWAEEGFRLRHELQKEAIKQGNITVDRKITGYRALLAFKPQGPTSTQLLAPKGIGLQGAAAGIGTRLSSRAANFVVTGTGISVTGHSMALNRGQFLFGNKPNRHGEWGMITALTAPGTRLTLA